MTRGTDADGTDADGTDADGMGTTSSATGTPSDILSLVEDVWGTDSPDLGRWAEKSDQELKELTSGLGLPVENGKAFFAGVEAATRAALSQWERLGKRGRKQVRQVLSTTAELIGDDRHLM